MRNILYIFISILFISGCSRVVDRYRVVVDAVALTNRVAPSTFYIKPLDPKVDELKFRRHSRRLANILIRKGFIESKSEEFAEQLIYFGYGIREYDRKVEYYREPDVSFGFSWRFPFHHRHSRFHSHIIWNDFGYNRYRAYTKVSKLYNRYLTIISKDRNGTELWRVDVESVGESNNIEAIVPILLKAVPDYIGKNLDKPITIDIDENLTKK